MTSPPFGHDYHDYDAATQRTSAQSQETADGLPSRLPAEVGVAYGTHPAVMRPRPILTPTDAPYVRSMRTDYQDSYLPHSITGNVGQRLPPPDIQRPSTSNSALHSYSSQLAMANYPSFSRESAAFQALSTFEDDENSQGQPTSTMSTYSAGNSLPQSVPGTPFSEDTSTHSSSRPPSAASFHPVNHPGYYRPTGSIGNSAYDLIHRPTPHRLLIRQRERTSLATSPFSRGSSQWNRGAGAPLPHLAASSSRDPHSRDYPSPRYSQTSQHSQPHENTGEHAQAQGMAPNRVSGAPTPVVPFHAITLDSLRSSFPLENHEHHGLRLKLLDVMNAPWRLANEQEPESQYLLQFTSRIEENGSEKYRCLFWSEGSECGKHIPRSDRMLEHLRRHIGVRPFVCDCNSDGCPGVFPSKSAMYQHQKNVEPVNCQRCGAQVLRQNLARHWRAQRCQRPDEAAASPDQLQQ